MQPQTCTPTKPFDHLRPKPIPLRAFGYSPQADILLRRTVLARLSTVPHPGPGR